MTLESVGKATSKTRITEANREGQMPAFIEVTAPTQNQKSPEAEMTDQQQSGRYL